MKTKYLDCACYSLGHVLRVTWDPEDRFYYLEYRINKWPKSNNNWVISGSYKNDNKFIFWYKLNVLTKIRFLKNYFENIWKAIIGLPLNFEVETILKPEEMDKLITFIKENK